jgi:hypothetical protein
VVCFFGVMKNEKVTEKYIFSFMSDSDLQNH